MLSFAESIAEYFHSEVNATWKVDSATKATAAFIVNTVSVEVTFEQREQGGAWHVGFNTVRGQTADSRYITLAFRIFNGVFQAIWEFVETREPDLLVFIAEDEDLATVYATYLRRDKVNIEQLDCVLEGPHRVELYTEWTLRRIKPSNRKN